MKNHLSAFISPALVTSTAFLLEYAKFFNELILSAILLLTFVFYIFKTANEFYLFTIRKDKKHHSKKDEHI
ncbi:hypothetical protein [Flavobacterium sp.]|uniref:hypothetical protein n=1 Tax=Flavobacterium sp. TaxID=239 RepID=UPI0025C14855|nr:hypothetical protein [Flavobacterium sp.]MBA4155567.1 hypothetical protein [Flavobacterium sp.]